MIFVIVDNTRVLLSLNDKCVGNCNNGLVGGGGGGGGGGRGCLSVSTETSGLVHKRRGLT